MIIPAKSIILASIGKPISDTTEGKKCEGGHHWKKILLPKTGETNDPMPTLCVEMWFYADISWESITFLKYLIDPESNGCLKKLKLLKVGKGCLKLSFFL